MNKTITETEGDLGRKLVACMDELTWERHGPMGVENAKRNQSVLQSKGRSLADLHAERHKVGKTDTALIIAAGPSIKRQDPIHRIKQSGYDGAIIATESALLYCLRNGVVPDLTVTLDPHATRIVRWFGDPHLDEAKISADDYFGRQDMDEAFARELEANREIMALMDEHGAKIRIALSSSASQAVVDRVTEIGMDIYWWNPMYDDPDQPGSITAELQAMNGLPCVNAGGNVGSACWMMADAVLEKRVVGLTGMDFAYYGDTPYRNTQYYHEAVALVGEDNLDAIYMHFTNPHTGAKFYTDPAYMWYRESLLEMIADGDCETRNCTEGGIIFGDSVIWSSLDDFLAEFAPKRSGGNR